MARQHVHLYLEPYLLADGQHTRALVVKPPPPADAPIAALVRKTTFAHTRHTDTRHARTHGHEERCRTVVWNSAEGRPYTEPETVEAIGAILARGGATPDYEMTRAIRALGPSAGAQHVLCFAL